MSLEHQQDVRSVPDGTRVAYHQFGYLHPEVEVNMVRGGTQPYARMEG